MTGNIANDLLFIVIIVIPLIAQINISASYKRYKEIKNKKGISGFEVARKILDAHGLEKIYIVETPGNLTDHYDPNRKVIKLSRDVFKGESIAALSVAAHECGHAIQDKESYKMMRLRSLIAPIVSLISSFSWWVIIIGFFTSYFNIYIFGIGVIVIVLIFQLVTLPVEFNASKRARRELEKLKLVDDEEGTGVKKMLTSAALTYVASVLTSILQIVRLFLLFNNDNR